MFEERLKNANVVVTGGSTETGPFICRAFARAGANIGFTYYSHKEEAAGVLQECENFGIGCRMYPLDLLDRESIDTFVEQVKEDWGRVDVLVLCAGSVGLRNFRDLSREQLDTAFDGNVKGNFTIAKELGFWMKETGKHGRIIQFTAMSAENTSHSAYGMAKAAQNSAGSFLAYNLAPEVTVNTIAPITIDQDPEHARAVKGESPLGRNVHARELARMCLLMCDEAFDSVTGEIVRMDCGRHVVPAYPRDL